MGTYRLKTSSTQVNEGDTLTTTLSTVDVITGTTLYYRVVGKGINAKDFSKGALTGTLKVGAHGKATISHTLKADKATEGSESLTIQVFSDKKMKKLVGTSKTATISDTSVKAIKGSATAGGGKDLITGIRFKSASGGKNSFEVIQNDKQYNLTEWNQKLNNLGFPSMEVSSGTFEYEFGNSHIVSTERITDRSGDTRLVRTVYSGNFKYSKGILASADIRSLAQDRVRYDDGVITSLSSEIFTKASPAKVKDASSANDWLSAQTQFRGSLSTENYINYINPENSRTSESAINAVRSFGGGNFLYDSWWSNPFDSNLI